MGNILQSLGLTPIDAQSGAASQDSGYNWSLPEESLFRSNQPGGPERRPEMTGNLGKSSPVGIAATKSTDSPSTRESTDSLPGKTRSQPSKAPSHVGPLNNPANRSRKSIKVAGVSRPGAVSPKKSVDLDRQAATKAAANIHMNDPSHANAPK